MERCLVTGATGFIGRALCDALKDRGLFVRATARRPGDGPWDELVTADLAAGDPPEDLLRGIDTIFHLAGKAHALAEIEGDESEYHRTNVGSTERLLAAAAREAPSRFVFVSSVKAADDENEGRMDETWDAPPATPYGRSKREAERLVLEAGRNHSDMHVCVLRLPLVYGPGVKGNLAKMMAAIARGRFPPVPENGNKRSMVHVADVARAAMLAAEIPAANGRRYIVTDGRAYSTRAMYEMMSEALGRKPPGWSVPAIALRAAGRVGDVIGRIRGRRFVFDSDACHKLLGSAWYDSRRIETELGFAPTQDLRQGVAEMAAAFRGTGAGATAS